MREGSVDLRFPSNDCEQSPKRQLRLWRHRHVSLTDPGRGEQCIRNGGGNAHNGCLSRSGRWQVLSINHDNFDLWSVGEPWHTIVSKVRVQYLAVRKPHLFE